MTDFQKIVKYIAMAFAVCLTVSIIGGILSMFGLFGGFFGGDAATEEMKTYSVSSDVRSLAVKINAADFTIRHGEAFSVESNLKYLSVEERNGVLTIEETKKFSRSYNGAVLTLTVPADTEFEKVNMVTGAGRLTADRLSAATMDFELGAGEVKIDTLIATSEIDLEGGAGKITVSGGALHNLDLDMGVGQLNLTSALTGECDFNFGVGESNVTVIGKKDDYRLDVEKGLGNVTVDGISVSNLKGQGGGPNSIDLSGGIGAIRLSFQEAKAE